MEYRNIKGYDGWYVAGDDGKIYSYKHNRWGRLKEPRALRPFRGPNGYLYVALANGDNTNTRMTVHRAVATAFLGDPPERSDTRHINGDKDDNSPANLAWGTRADNMADCILHGRTIRGDRHPRARLNEQAIKVIRFFRGKKPTKLLASLYKTTPQHVRAIQRGEEWSWVR